MLEDLNDYDDGARNEADVGIAGAGSGGITPARKRPYASVSSLVTGPDEARIPAFGSDSLAGSALFPTAGRANPTLTIIALTLRLAEHLAGRLAARPEVLGNAA